MRERLRKLRDDIKEKWIRMTKRQRVIISIAAGFIPLALVAVILFFVLRGSAPKMDVLYSHLSGPDANAVITDLKKDNIKYELADDGTTIKVDKKDVSETRIKMAGKGLPKGGTSGYELFDTTKLGVTDFTQKINKKRALEGELTRTISGLDNIETARIMINQPEPSLFVTEQKRPSASVAVKLKGKEKLSEDQIRGIMNLVASSLEGMEPGDVKIIDSSGAILSDLERRKDERERLQMSEIQIKQKIELEERYEQKIRKYLAKVFGDENIVVAVSAELDFSKTKKEDILYEPIRLGADAGVIRSQQNIAEKYLGTGTVPEIGVPGTTSNIPGYKGLAEGNAQYERTEDTTNYEITEYRTSQEKNQGDIRRLQVAVILNEGLKNKAGEVYDPKALVRDMQQNIFAAANLENSKDRKDAVDVKVFNFKMDKTLDVSGKFKDQEKRQHMMRLIKYGLIALVLLGIIIMSIFMLRSSVVPEEIPEEVEEEDIVAEEPVPVEELLIPELSDEQRMREKIREEVMRLIHDDPEGAALIVRSWLFAEED